MPLEDIFLKDEFMKEQVVEEQEGDERVFKLVVDGTVVCVAKTLPYSYVGDIKTAKGEEGKGYAKKLLTHIEKIAKEHNAKTMETTDIDPCSYKAVCLLKSLGYKFAQIKGDAEFIKATKDLVNDTEFPSEVTEGNLQQLTERATRIKKKAGLLIYATIILYMAIDLVAMPILFYVVGRLLLSSLPQLPLETFFGIFLVVFAVIFFLFSYALIGWIEWGLMRAFRLPKYDERIFAECFIIASYLTSNEKKKAAREVDDFVMHLSTFVRTGPFFRGREYAQEFDLLISGKTQIRRMLLFSEEKVPELLRNFGLALVRNEDPKAFRFLKQVLSEVRKYGKLEGRLRRILAGMEKYQTAITLVLFIVSVILTIMGILPH